MMHAYAAEGPPRAPARRLPGSVVLPVPNEQRNLPAVLARVVWEDEVIVVDSRSSNRAIARAPEAGATVVHFVYAGGGPRTEAWALANLGSRSPCALLHEADARVPEVLQGEIAAALNRDDRNGSCVDRLSGPVTAWGYGLGG